jgi:hypothetical protein
LNRFSKACAALLEWPYDRLDQLPYISDVLDRDDAVAWMVFSLLAFLPQVLAALVGGLLASSLIWIIRLPQRERKV